MPLPKTRSATGAEEVEDETTESPSATWAGCLDADWPEEGLTGLGVPIRVVPPGKEPPQDGRSGRFWRIAWRMPWTGGDADTPDWLQVAVLRQGVGSEAGDPAVRRTEQNLREHHDWVETEAVRIATDLALPEDYRRMLAIAARWHDAGKARSNWQRAMGAPTKNGPYAKTKGGGNLALLRINNEIYRHEFGSLKEADASAEIAALPEPLRDLALHLIAAHHGNGRPTLTAQDWNQPDAQARQRRAQETAMRFSRLHHAWGPWGLAWWEALLRAADRAASAKLDASAAKQEGDG